MKDELFGFEAETIENKANGVFKYEYENQDLNAIAHQINYLTQSVLLLARTVQERMYPGEY